MAQYHFDPGSCAQLMADGVPAYGRMQEAVADACAAGPSAASSCSPRRA